MEKSETIKRLDEVVGRINTHPEYSRFVAREVTDSLWKEAEKHSLELELRSKEELKDEEKKTGELMSNLERARNYLATYGIDLSTLAALGPIVAPRNGNNRLRMDPKRDELASMEVPAPAPEKVIFMLKDLASDLTTLDLHPIRRGVVAELGITGIHPYIDGNGRTARLFRNFCLEERGYPSGIIVASDREIYTKLLRNALRDRHEGRSSSLSPSESELFFGAYIASKVLSSAEQIEESLKRRRIYDIEIAGVRDKPIAISVKQQIAALGRRGDSYGVDVTIKNGGRKNYGFSVIGDVSLKDLNLVLERCARRYGFNYEAKPNRGCPKSS